MAGDKTYITDDQGKLHRATRVHAVTPTEIVWSNNRNDYSVQVKIDGKWHRAILTYDVSAATYFDNVNIDKALVTGADGKQHTALIVNPENAVTLSPIKTDEHAVLVGTTTGETAVCTYSEAWSDIQWQDNVNVYKVLVTGSDGKVHTAILTTGGGGGAVEAIVMGVSPLSLPDAVAANIVSLIAYGGTEQRNIPQPYTQVNYVTNTAQTAVNTGIMIDFAKNYEFEVECRAVSGSWYILQSRASSTGNITGIHGATSGSTITLVVGNVTVCTSAITRTAGNKLYVKATLNAGTATLYVKDKTANTEDTQTGSYGTSQPNPTAAVYLLGNAGGQYVDVNSDIYMARIKENDTAVMDYVPARQVATAGFYDTVSGTFKTALTPANLSADGNTVPTPDAPMDIVCNNGVLSVSYNLYNPSTQVSGKYLNDNGVEVNNSAFAYSDYIPVKVGETITASLYKTASGSGKLRIHTYDSSKTWIEMLYGQTVSAADITVAGTVTIPAGVAYIRVSWFNDENSTEKQVSKSGTMLPYMPYGKIYTDGTVETINIHSKNIYNKNDANTEFSGYVSNTAVGNTGTVSSYVGGDKCLIIKVKPNTTYTITRATDLGTVYDRIRVLGSVVRPSGGTQGTMLYNLTGNRTQATATFTTLSDTEYVAINVRNTGTVGDDWQQYKNAFMVEEGSTATDYQPYFDGGTATAEMLLSVGDYTDQQEIIDGTVTRKVGVLVLNGTENWTQGAASPTFKASINITDSEPKDRQTCLCSHFDVVKTATTAGVGDAQCAMFLPGGAATYDKIVIGKYDMSNITDFKTWLAGQYAAGTPVIVVYPLATATTESVTGQPMQTAAGDNTAEITQAGMAGLELEVTYMKQGA